MSTTAGVGSQEYVEINLVAVWAAVLGLLSFLALLDNVLLIVPVIGIVFAIVALRQIANSAGTQTGRGIALAALLLSLGFAGVSIAGQVIETTGNHTDRQAIVSTIEGLGEDLKVDNVDAAYGRFSPEFRNRVTKEKFVEQTNFLRQSQLYGSLTRMTWNGNVRFDGSAGGEQRFAESVLLIHWDKAPDPLRLGIYLRRREGKWSIDGIENMFQVEKPKGAGAAAGQ